MTKKRTRLSIEYIELDQLLRWPGNPKRHDLDAIEESFSRSGFVSPVIINEKTGQLLVGHGRLEKLEQLKAAGEEPPARIEIRKRDGAWKVPVIRGVSFKNKKDAIAYCLADNKVSELGGWDNEKLHESLSWLLKEGEDNLAGTGFDTSDHQKLSNILGGLIDSQGKTDPDCIPTVPKKSNSKPGKIYQLGRHRLLCSDFRNTENLDKLLQGNKCDMIFSDPPYLMNFTGSMTGDGQKSFNGKHKKIENDNLKGEEAENFLDAFCQVFEKYLLGAFYICFYRLAIDLLMNALTRNKLKWRNLIVWKKNHFTLSNSDYKSQYEPIVTGWADDYNPILYGWNKDHDFYGTKGECDTWEIELPSLWEINRTKKNDLHPTIKPIALCTRAILNSSLEDQSVLDLFGGSGSTLIACEQTDRCCYMSEMETEYCDVIRKRWAEFVYGEDCNWRKLTAEVHN